MATRKHQWIVDDRAALEGSLFVLHTGHTAWRRLRQWEEAEVWEQLHRAVLEEL